MQRIVHATNCPCDELSKRQDKCLSQYFSFISAKTHYIKLNFFLRDAELNSPSMPLTFRVTGVAVLFQIMKDKDSRKLVSSKLQTDDGLTKIFRNLSGGFCPKTVKRWCKVIDQTGSINISHILSCLRIIRTPATIEKVNN